MRDSMEDRTSSYQRMAIPFNNPHILDTDAKAIFTNAYGKVRAISENGILEIQTKKLPGDQREVIRINFKSNPPTFEIVLKS
jgi:hypothetical protein